MDNMNSILNQRHLAWTRKYFGRYRAIVKRKRVIASKARKILNNIHAHNLRWGFYAWATRTTMMIDKQNLNEIGPVTEQVFEANRAIRNLKDFMSSENYEPEEIDSIYKDVCDTNDYQMHKIVKRLKINRDDRMMCRCFDHLAFLVKMKKLMAYHLRICNASVTPVMCDLRQVFMKWKTGDYSKMKYLEKKKKLELMDLSTKHSSELNKIADEEARAQAVIDKLNKHRDRLLDHKIRSQKLAFSRIQDGYKQDLGIALNRWKAFTRVHARDEGKLSLAQAINDMTQKKEKMVELELENNKMTGNALKLRNFISEGGDIAKQVIVLGAERDELKK